MSKRTGDVQVADYIVCYVLAYSPQIHFILLYQNGGWEPEALLNWLALVGWGNRYGDAEHVKLQRGKSVPDIFTLGDLTSKV